MEGGGRERARADTRRIDWNGEEEGEGRWIKESRDTAFAAIICFS